MLFNAFTMEKLKAITRKLIVAEEIYHIKFRRRFSSFNFQLVLAFSAGLIMQA
jgi:hypothetical protein